jgi:hypothetical protein
MWAGRNAKCPLRVTTRGGRLDVVRVRRGVILLVLSLSTALALQSRQASATAPQRGNPKCIFYTAQASLGVAGYNHFVTVANRCTQTAACEVVTSANPEPTSVVVPASEERTVITYRESPARVFEVAVRCTLRPA